MTPDNKRKALKCIALAIAALVTVGSFFAVPWIARAIPASFTSLLMLSSPATPVVALRPEPKPHESILWEESEPSAPPEEEESGDIKKAKLVQILPNSQSVIPYPAYKTCVFVEGEEVQRRSARLYFGQKRPHQSRTDPCHGRTADLKMREF